MPDEAHVTIAEVVATILADLERAKLAKSCVLARDSRDGGAFVLPGGGRVWLNGNDLAVVVSHLLGITTLEWEE